MRVAVARRSYERPAHEHGRRPKWSAQRTAGREARPRLENAEISPEARTASARFLHGPRVRSRSPEQVEAGHRGHPGVRIMLSWLRGGAARSFQRGCVAPALT